MPLTECTYTIEGPGVSKAKENKFRDVKPNEVVTLSESFTAKKAGVKKIVVNFNSKQVHNIHGTSDITLT